MPYKTFWLKEDRIVFAELVGEFAGEEMITFNEHLRDSYLVKGKPPVHIICDISSLVAYPRNVKMIRNGSEISMKHPNVGWVIIVGHDNRMLRFLSSTVFQLLGINFKMASSLEEAEKVLERVEAAAGGSQKVSTDDHVF